jgi:hypothetical protein
MRENDRMYSVETNGRIFRVVKWTWGQRDGGYWEPLTGHDNILDKEAAWRVADALEEQRPKPWRPAER